ncbi:uncharacterized protein LOC128731409 [Anopheles nili]|uniref:uncharacterized protein LOC128731409 n=1 Tax=Anopheles nili TaxID=185578 RepID=UPI00237A8CD9|nr:uncharacterized protein LOC128731409 [Anopheles nili]
MSCCCLVVSYHLIVNLVNRFTETVRDAVHCRYRSEVLVEPTSSGFVMSTGVNDLTDSATGMGGPRYVVINDTVELEPFYHDVDRRYSELLLRNCPEGTCIVRPFKLKHERIRYVLSIRGPGTFFHLFIRHAGKNGMYALGLEKEHERRFKFPADIVRYYQVHLLECTRAQRTIRLQLLPLPGSDAPEKTPTRVRK